MSGPTDWDDLAKRYLDLWQEQLMAMGTDPQLTEQFARMAQDMAARGLAGPMAGVAGTGSGMGGDGQPDGGDEAGAAAAGDASGQRDQRLDELERRIGAVEKRLDDLAAGAGRSG